LNPHCASVVPKTQVSPPTQHPRQVAVLHGKKPPSWLGMHWPASQ
jgi:hypothetical protein